ncbi:MAG: hypothetical protein M3323_15380 [Actinomycetota bacterium]|nr:hypothetical protein [Actinomycetota bacterium]
MRRTAFLLAALLVAALGACGGDDEDPAAAATSTPEATAAPAPASEAPASEAPASQGPASAEPNPGPTAGKATPEEAAQAFYADWGELDSVSASGYATQAAIDEAFGQTRAQAEFTDCLEEDDHFSCFFYYEGGGLGMTVVDSDAYGFIVTDVNYVAD